MSVMLTIVEVLSFAMALWFLLRWEERRHEMDIADSPEGASARRPLSLWRCVAWTVVAFGAVELAREMPWYVTAVAAAIFAAVWLRRPARRALLYRRMADVNGLFSRWFARRSDAAMAAAEDAASRNAEADTEIERKANLMRAWLFLHS